jgi:TP901 family phage tail tape measure protein
VPDISFRLTSTGASAVLGNIGEVNSYIRSVNTQLQTVFNQGFGNIFSGGFGAFGTGFGSVTKDLSLVGPAVRTARIEVDALNNSLKVYGETGIRTVTMENGKPIPGWISTGDVATISGNADKWTAAMKKVADAEAGLANITQSATAQIQAPFQAQLSTLEKQSEAWKQYSADLEGYRQGFIARGEAIPASLTQQIELNEAAGVEIAAQTKETYAAMATATQEGLAGANPVPEYVAQTNALKAAIAERDAAITMPAPNPAYVTQTLAASPQLAQILQKAGLQMNNLAGTTNFSQPMDDLTLGVKKVSGSFVDAEQNAKSFSAQLSSDGTVLNRFGGTLSGTSGFLAQVGRDFQKVAEWAIATTAIIGTIGAIKQMVTEVSDLDLGLRKFAITAQVSTDESKAFFQSIAEVAYNTATPLKELVDSADAIALATRKAGQSSEQWKQDILSLTSAVGILTNIAGIDSVKATDLLTATMKQLDLTAEQTAGVLNKIAAVAGGQSTAIADIAQGLGTLSEAAKTAGLSLDQQIAVLQTLGQVTGKSSTEIATSMKNLTGSISSSGSVKELEKFGIAVKDAQGNLYPFLEIYQKIADAIKSGLIPAGQEQAVEKAISGGPRRMPDAAALLGVMDQVNSATTVSANASNEALVANAQVLDSTTAKMTQLKVLFDQLAFNNFDTIINQVAGSLLDLAKIGVQVFSQLPTGIIATIAQFALLAGGIGVVVKLFTGFGGLVGGTIKTIVDFVSRITTATVSATGLSKAETLATTSTMTLEEAQIKMGQGVNVATSQINTNTEATLQNANAKKENAAATGLMSTALGRGAAMLGIAGLAGGVIGAAQVMNGGSPNPQSIASGVGSGLMGLGMTGLVAGGALDAGVVTLPAGLTLQGVSIAATALGGALQVISGMLPGATQDTTQLDQANVQLNQDILQSVKTFQDASQQATNLGTVHKTLTDQLTEQSIVVDKTTAGQNTLSATQKDYADNIAQLQIQNVSLQASYEKLAGYYPQLGTGVQSYSDLLSTAAQNTDLLKTKTEDLSKAILIGTGQASKVGTNLQLPNYNATVGNIPYAGNGPPIAWWGGTTVNDAANINTLGQISVPPSTLNLSDLTSKPEEVLQLFDSATGQLKASIPRTQQAFDLIDSALTAEAQVSGANVDLINKYHQSLADQAQAQGNLNDIINQTVTVWNANWAAQNIIGTMTVDQMNSLESAASGWQTLATLQASIPTQTMYGVGQDQWQVLTPAASELKDVLDKMHDTISAGNIPALDELKAAYIASLHALGINTDAMSITTQQVYTWADRLMPGIPAIDNIVKAFNQTATDLSAWDSGLQKEVNKLATSVQSQAVKVAQEQLAAGKGLLSKSGQFKLDNSTDEQSAAATADWEKFAKSMKSSVDMFAPFLDSGTAVSDLLTGLMDKTNLFAGAESELTDTTQTAGDKLGWLIDNMGTLDTAFGVSKKAQDAQIDALKTYIQVVGELYAKLATLASEPFDVQIRFITSMGGAAATMQNYQNMVNLNKKSGEGVAPPTYQQWLSQQEATLVQNKAQKDLDTLYNQFLKQWNTGTGGNVASAGGSSSSTGTTSAVEIPQDWITAGVNIPNTLKEAVAWAKKYQSAIPGENAKDKNDIVAVMEGNTRVLLERGISEANLTKGLEALTAQVKAQNDLLNKADMIRRIRVGSGDFAALANVPMNSVTGVSVGSSQGPVTVNLNLNGQILTPAQMQQFGNLVGAAIARQLAGGTTG